MQPQPPNLHGYNSGKGSTKTTQYQPLDLSKSRNFRLDSLLEGTGFELPVPRCALIANSAALVAPPDSAVRGGSLTVPSDDHVDIEYSCSPAFVDSLTGSLTEAYLAIAVGTPITGRPPH